MNRRHGSTRPAERALKEQDPSSTLAGHQYVARSRRDFPDLKRKTVWAKKAIAPKPGGEAGAGAAIRDIAIGESGSTQRVRPVGLVEAVSRAAEAVPAFLACVVDALQDLDGYDVEVLTCSESDGWTVPITLLADEDGVIADEHFVVEKSDQRPRRVAAFNVVKGRDCAVLAAVEAEQLMPFLYPVSGCDGDTLWQAIRCVAKDFISVTGRGRKAGLSIDWRLNASESNALIKAWLADLFEEE